MSDRFRLTPIDRKHTAWQYSIACKTIFIFRMTKPTPARGLQVLLGTTKAKCALVMDSIKI